MHHRDPRSTYAYEDQNAYYANGQILSQPPIDYPVPASQYQDGYEGPSSNYYLTNGTGGSNHGPHPSHSHRAPTPAAHAPRYVNGVERDARYYQTPSGMASSSAIPVSGYSSQSQYYSQQQLASSGHRSHHSGQSSQASFVPTPSDLAQNYQNYHHPVAASQTSTAIPPENYSPTNLEYPVGQYVVPSQGSSQRPGRIVTNRTTSGNASASPTLTASPTGERFACEKCGKTFSRSHDRKRHHETQHLPSPIIHRCRFCEKEFSRADSLKRHLDNGCDEMP